VDYAGFAAAIASAVFWTRGAAIEGISPLVWVGASLVVSVLTMMVLRQGWMGVLVGQVGLLAAITLFRTLGDKGSGATDE
jgi:hypothetical protein